MSDNPDLRLCTIADVNCQEDNQTGWLNISNLGVSVIREFTPLEKAVEVLNEAMHTVPGVASHLHWPLPMLGDAENSNIECFMSQDAVTTNILGVLNAIVSFTKDGILHRIEYSKEENRYFVASVVV